MPQLILTPPKVSFSDNPIRFGFKTNNYVISPGVKAVLKLYFGTVHYGAFNYHFDLVLGSDILTFQMVTTPDESGLQFPHAITGDDNLTWMKKIADALYSNYLISENYSIAYTYNLITLTAKQPGIAWNITCTNIACLGMSSVNTAGADASYRPFFNIYAHIVCDGKIIGRDRRPVLAENNGIAYFNFSEYLRCVPKNTFQFPENVNSLIFDRPCIKAFYLRYDEFYSEGNIPLHHRLHDTGTFYIIPGGVNKMTEALYNDFYTSFWEQLQANHQFMTWAPLIKKKCAPEDMQKLWFLTYCNLTQIKLKARLYFRFSNGTYGQSTTLTKKVFPASQYKVYEILCGYNRMQLNIDALTLPAGSTVISYDVFLTDQADNIISELRTFEFDFRYYVNKRTFIFRNSFGVYETFVATGERIDEADYERNVVRFYRDVQFTERDPDSRPIDISETMKYTINSGYIDDDVLDWLRELQLSKEVYEVVGNILYPRVITGTSTAMKKDNEYLHSMEIEYIHAFTDEHYSLEKSVFKQKPYPPHVIVTADTSNNSLTSSQSVQQITHPPVPTYPLPVPVIVDDHIVIK